MREVLFGDLLGENNARVWDGNLFLSDNFKSGIMPGFLVSSLPRKIQFATIVLCRAGEVAVRLNMEPYVLHADDLMLLSPGVFGEQLQASPDCKLLVIAFSEEVYNISAKNSVSAQLRNLFYRKPLLIGLPHPYSETLTAHYRMLRDVICDVSFTQTEEVVRSHINIISAYALHCAQVEQRGQPEPTRYERMFDQFLRDVKDHCARERSVAFYADRLFITPKYLSRVVMEVSGRHPTDWIRDYVLLDSKALLLRHDLSVQQVADMMGFPNPSFFGKYFREHVGCTPREYQNQNQEGATR